MQTINDRIGIILNESKKTKTAFAKSLKVSQQYISKLIKTGNPSDILIEDICQKHGINETWLRAGEGKMFTDLSKENQLMDWAGRVLKDESDSFKRRFVNMLMELDDSDWETLEKIALKLQKENS